MNCTQCGAPISGESSFCNQCGARLEQIEVEQQIAREQAVPLQELKQTEAPITPMAPVTRQTMGENYRSEEIKNYNQLEKENSLNKQRQTSQEIHGSETRNKVSQFINTMIAIIKKPFMGADELSKRVEKVDVFLYPLVLILISGWTTFITYKIALSNFLSGMFSLVAGISDYFEVDYLEEIQSSPFIQEAGLKVFSYVVLSHCILMALLVGFTLVVFRGIKKVPIYWEECIRLLISPLAVLGIGKLGVLVLTLINGSLGFYFYMIMMFTVMILTILQFVNLLGKSSFVVYCIPAIYIISALLRNKIILEIIKTSLNKYFYLN